jgi:hypothetical protein
VHCETWVELEAPAALFRDDPALGGAPVGETARPMMGQILTGVAARTVTFGFELSAACSIERVEICNRTRLIELFRPYAPDMQSRRIRVLWEGSEYRGRGRETLWQGTLALTGNNWREVRPINRFNLDRRFEVAPDGLAFEGVTTGGFMGVEAMLAEPTAGELVIETNILHARLPVRTIGHDDTVFEAGGLGRRVRAFRLPPANHHRRVRTSRSVALRADEDNALFIRATLEDGNVVWSSPIYLVP